MNNDEYRIMYEVEDRHWWYESLRLMILSHWRRFNYIRDALVLDAGCGTGGNLAFITPLARSVGLDISRDALEYTRSRGVTALMQGSVADLPVDAEAFDAVLLMDVLYHRAVPDKVGALKEALRALKPGGIVLINVPAFQWLKSSHDEAIHTDRRFTRRELRSLLHEAGFAPVRVAYWNTFLFPAAAAVRLLRRKSPAGGHSDLAGYSDNWLAGACRFLLKIEIMLLEFVPMPFGLSIFAVGRKPN